MLGWGWMLMAFSCKHNTLYKEDYSILNIGIFSYKSENVNIEEHIRTKHWTKFWFSNSPIFFHQVLKALILWHKGLVGDGNSIFLQKGISFSELCPLSVDIFVVAALNKLFTFFIDFYRTTGPVSTKIGTKHFGVMGIQFCSNERPPPFSKGR